MESMLDILENETEDLQNTDLYSLLNMVGKQHSIIIDKQIGLIAIDEDKEYNTYNSYGVATINDLLHSRIKVGDKFQVIDADGCILFDFLIKSCGIIIKGAETLGYCFKLSDCCDIDDMEMLLGNVAKKDAIIIYSDNKLFARKNYEGKLPSNIIIDSTIDLQSIDNIDLLTFNNNIYVSSPIDVNNNILQYRLHEEGEIEE